MAGPAVSDWRHVHRRRRDLRGRRLLRRLRLGRGRGGSLCRLPGCDLLLQAGQRRGPLRLLPLGLLRLQVLD